MSDEPNPMEPQGGHAMDINNGGVDMPRHEDFEVHVEEARTMDKQGSFDRSTQQLTLDLQRQAGEAMKLLPTKGDRPGLEMVPFLVTLYIIERMASLCRAAAEAQHRIDEQRSDGARVKGALAAYRELRRVCRFARHVPEEGDYAEHFQAVVEDHPLATLGKAAALYRAIYGLSVFASEHKEVLAKVPGGLEAIPPAVAWLERLAAAEEDEELPGLRDAFLRLALVEHGKVREAARFLWARKHPELVRRLRLPRVRRAANPAEEESVEESAESSEAEVAEEAPQPAPLPYVGPTE